MKVYAIMSDMGYDGYFLDDIKSSFELAKKQVEDNGPSLHGNIDVVEWEVDNPGGVPVFNFTSRDGGVRKHGLTRNSEHEL